MRKPLRVLLLGTTHLCALFGGIGGALLVGEPPMDPLAGMAMSWGQLTLPPDLAEETLEERLRSHDAYLDQLVSPESEDTLLLGRLVTWSRLAAASDGSTRERYLKQAEQACHRLEWDDCAEDVLTDIGEKQENGVRRP